MKKSHGVAAAACAAAVAAVLALPATAAAPAGGFYGGVARSVFADTRTPWPASLQLTADGKKIKSFLYVDTYECSDGRR